MTYDEAAGKAGIEPGIRDLVVAMLASGFSDFHDWADHTLREKAAA